MSKAAPYQSDPLGLTVRLARSEGMRRAVPVEEAAEHDRTRQYPTGTCPYVASGYITARARRLSTPAALRDHLDDPAIAPSAADAVLAYGLSAISAFVAGDGA